MLATAVGAVTPGCYNRGVGGAGFAVVDVETNGLSTRRDRVLQVGVVALDPHGDMVDTWSSLVRLPWRFSRVGPRHIHGITRRSLRDAPALDVVMSSVRSLVGGRILVGHNLDFDREFLERAARRVKLPLDVHGHLCTLVLSRRLDPDRQLSHRLVDVSSRYGVTIDRPHDALADAIATAEVLPYLLAGYGVDLSDVEGSEQALAPLLGRNGHR